MRRLPVVVFGVLLAAVALTLVGTWISGSDDRDAQGAPSVGTAPNTVVFPAVADAYVAQSKPFANTGASVKLRVDGSPVVKALLRFRLQGIRIPISRATLTVYATSTSIDGFRVQPVPDSRWNEHSVSYATAPPAGITSPASADGFRKGNWVSVDITSLVRAAAAAARRDQMLSIALTSTSASALSLASRESGAHAPYITVHVTPANVGRSTSKTSVVGAASGSGTFAVRVLGAAHVGQLLAASVKMPANHLPHRFRFQWQVCDWNGSACAPISGVTRQRLRVGTGQLGQTLRVRVSVTASTRTRVLLSRTTPIVQGASDPVIAAAGDIACDPASAQFKGGVGSSKNCRQRWTSDLLLNAGLSAVLPLGDLQYACGLADAFAASYVPSWGRLKSITRPALGNHEYGKACSSNDASPYFAYFGALAGSAPGGWYSYDVGAWHLIALNSECGYGSGAAKVGGCGAGSPEETWLRQDLAAHANVCTLAYWHEPRFSSGEHGDTQSMAVVWNDLVAAHADLVLSGHNHDYERFEPIGATPQDSADSSSTTTAAPNYQEPLLDANGIRQFVVGTGGKNHYGFGSQPPLAGEVVRDSSTYGVLKLTLHPTGYDWRFVNDPGSGSFTDSGTAACH